MVLYLCCKHWHYQIKLQRKHDTDKRYKLYIIDANVTLEDTRVRRCTHYIVIRLQNKNMNNRFTKEHYTIISTHLLWHDQLVSSANRCEHLKLLHFFYFLHELKPTAPCSITKLLHYVFGVIYCTVFLVSYLLHY